MKNIDGVLKLQFLWISPKCRYKKKVENWNLISEYIYLQVYFKDPSIIHDIQIVDTQNSLRSYEQCVFLII